MLAERYLPALSACVISVFLAGGWLRTAGAVELPPAADAAMVKRGSLLFLQCIACHDVTSDKSHEPGDNVPRKIGPNLREVLGRSAASLDGYVYSEALRRSGLIWDQLTLDRWLEKPAALVPGTTMVFAGVAKEADRRALLAYLESVAH